MSEGLPSSQGARSPAEGVGRRWRGRGRGEATMVPPHEPRSYYGQPVIKPPVWTWEIPAYLFTGGLGGASSTLALGAELAGNRVLARRGWATALAAIALSPALLTSDLGRPLRFLNMLRVFKLSSPMSVGSWILIANGAAVTPAALSGVTGLGFPGSRVAKLAAGALGVPLATYTAVLLTNTAIPAWSEARRELPIVFAGSAAASAGAAAVALTPAEDARPARRLAAGGALAEVLGVVLMEHRLRELAGPYHEGPTEWLSRAAKALTSLGGLTVAATASRSRQGALAGAAMLLGGSLCERWAVFSAGFGSARDPRYTVGPQRDRAEWDRRDR